MTRARPLTIVAALFSLLLGLAVTAAPAGADTARSMSVSPSSSSADISALQHLLTSAGVPTDADGAFGPQTTASVETFQSQHGLAVDGEPGPNTMAALVPVISSGSSNSEAVAAVQTLLTSRGYGLDVDGQFGPATTNAVTSFQSSQGLTADGIVGQATWSYLFGGGSGAPSSGDCDAVTSGVPESQTVVAASNIRVNTCLAGAVQQMVSDAAAAGITLSANSSWRDPSEQIELRKQNCGTSDYAIYQMPASDCSPPTAIPGTSRHERGLAIDFANCGSHDTAVFGWLAANASRYHLSNLPSESWHWSWDGY